MDSQDKLNITLELDNLAREIRDTSEFENHLGITIPSESVSKRVQHGLVNVIPSNFKRTQFWYNEDFCRGSTDGSRPCSSRHCPLIAVTNGRTSCAAKAYKKRIDLDSPRSWETTPQICPRFEVRATSNEQTATTTILKRESSNSESPTEGSTRDAEIVIRRGRQVL